VFRLNNDDGNRVRADYIVVVLGALFFDGVQSDVQRCELEIFNFTLNKNSGSNAILRTYVV